MKKGIFILGLTLALASCGNSTQNTATSVDTTKTAVTSSVVATVDTAKKDTTKTAVVDTTKATK